MFWKLKVISFKKMLRYVWLPSIIAVLILLLFLKDTIIQARGPVDLTTLDADDLNGKFVTMKITKVYGQYMKEDGKITRIGYVVIPEGLTQCIGAVITTDHDSAVDTLISDTLFQNGEYTSSEPITVTGVIKKVKDFDLPAYHAKINNINSNYGTGLTGTDYAFYETSEPFGSLSGLLSWSWFGAIALLLCIVSVLLSFTGFFQLQVFYTLDKMTPEAEQNLKIQLETGKKFHDSLIITPEYTLAPFGPFTVLIKNENIKKIYTQRVKYTFLKQKENHFKLVIETKDYAMAKVCQKEVPAIVDYYKTIIKNTDVIFTYS